MKVSFENMDQNAKSQVKSKGNHSEYFKITAYLMVLGMVSILVTCAAYTLYWSYQLERQLRETQHRLNSVDEQLHLHNNFIENLKKSEEQRIRSRIRRQARGEDDLLENCFCKPGPKGSKGDKGYEGPRGRRGQGEKGKEGKRGPPGPSIKGERGDKGEIGPSQGPRGFPGFDGTPGEKGDNGIMGIPGPTGPVGPPGLTGPQGVQGPPGDVGPMGPEGSTGRDGRKGTRGEKGEKGDEGTTSGGNFQSGGSQTRAIHLVGNSGNTLVGNNGDLTKWDIATDYGGFTLLADGNLTVSEAGQYYIYSQILFYDEEAIFAAHTNINGKPFMTCMGVRAQVALKFVPCQSMGVSYLEKNDRVGITSAYPNKVVDMDPESTYFGIIQL